MKAGAQAPRLGLARSRKAGALRRRDRRDEARGAGGEWACSVLETVTEKPLERHALPHPVRPAGCSAVSGFVPGLGLIRCHEAADSLDGRLQFSPSREEGRPATWVHSGPLGATWGHTGPRGQAAGPLTGRRGEERAAHTVLCSLQEGVGQACLAAFIKFRTGSFQ